MKFCTSCGVEVSEQASFCSNCGASLAPVAPPKAPVETPVAAPVEAPVATPAVTLADVPVEEAPVAPPAAAPVAPAIPADAVFCTNCGNACNKNAVICVKCGHSLSAPSAAANTASDTIFCTTCGNACNKNAVICVKCGQSLTGSRPSAKASAPAAAPKKTDAGKVISIVSIIFCAIDVLTVIFNLFTSIAYSFDDNPIPRIISIVGSILLLIGFIKGKRNKLPGIGYIVSILSSIVHLIAYGNDITFVFILSLAKTLMLAALYLGKNKTRKLWFAPIAIYALIVVVNIISNFSSYDYLGIEYAIINISSLLGGIIGTVITCLNAKFNWHNPDEPEDILSQF